MPALAFHQQRGVITMMALMVVSVFALTIIFTVTDLALNDSRMTGSMTASGQAFAGAETGIEEALYRLATTPGVEHLSLTLDGGHVEVALAPNPADSFQRIITATSTDPTGKRRVVRLVVQTSFFSGGFDSAVQTGGGGLEMDNNSWVDGNVFSNGSILGGSGVKREIRGNVTVAGAGTLDNIWVRQLNGSGATAYAQTIKNAVIDEDAYYQDITDSTVAGTAHPGSPNRAPMPLAIDDADLQLWKNEITALGQPAIPPSALTDCPAQAPYDSGTYYCITTATTLGGRKIEADVYVKGDVTLTLDGNLWITGKLIFGDSGNGALQAAPSLGDGSAVIMTDGTIDISNNYAVQGSGSPKSFVLLVTSSPNIDVEPPAIFASNGSQSLILAAPHGEIRVKNGGAVNASLAEKIRLNQNSHVTYNVNLASFFVPGANGNAMVIVPDTWEER
ncbi:MAG: hypothetical protein G01um101431_328 [Parcubacteria group bacterium Gr01-1014_31]|nr:MAG: hypothetical protein G01um101431_328 [Parcubacteria group bacterium Gr01-1014_31]